MPILKNSRHERFAVARFKGRSLRDAAIDAGYSVKTVNQTASRLLTYVNISDRIQELHKEAASDAIMTMREIMERLTEIGRARLTDYVTCGPDRDLINVGPESPNTGALQEITSRTEYDKDGAGVAVITKLKLHAPMTAMDLLNKMRGDYPPNKLEVDPGETLKPYLDLLTRIREYQKEEGDGFNS